MKNKNEALQLAICNLQEKRNLQLEAFKSQYFKATESLKLINIIKNTFKEIAESSEIKTSILENVIGIGTGIIAKKLLIRNSKNVYNNFFASIVQFFATNLASNQAENLRTKIEKLAFSYLNYRKELKKSKEEI